MPTETKEAEAKVVRIPLDELFPSKTNRKIPDTAVAEMAASIKLNGVLQPIIVRARKAGGFEIVCGEVRFRGAQAVGNGVSMPAVVRELSDEEAQAMQIVENLHRSNPTAMEEAQAFGNLRKLLGKNATIEQVAAQVGKDAPHVAQRLKLLDLCPEAQKALIAGKGFGVGHALLIAPLHEDQQRDILKWMFDFEEEVDRERYNGELIKSVHSLTAVRAFIEREFMLALDKAPFDIKSEALDKAMGSCIKCPHNTANATSLFPDTKGATCTLPSCYFGKTRAAIDIKVDELTKADGKKPYRLGYGSSYQNKGKSSIPVDGYLAVDSYSSGPRLVRKGEECKSTRTAILVYRSRDERESQVKAAVGDTALVCPNPECEKHGRRSSGGGTGSTRTALRGMAFVNHKSANMTKSRPQRLRWAVFKDLVEKLLKAVIPATSPVNLGCFEMAADRALHHLYHDAARDAAKALGLEKPKKGGYQGASMHSLPDWRGSLQKHCAGNAWALLIAVNAAEDIRSDHKKPETSSLFKIAKLYKVDVAKLLDEIKTTDKALVDKMSVNAKAREAREKATPKVPKVAKASKAKSGTCQHCGCTMTTPCNPPCAWANRKQTICTNPACLKKAGFSKAKIKQLSSAA